MESATFGGEAGTVKTTATGEDDRGELLFVMGWGNRLDGDNERWFTAQLVEAGYRVNVVELPTNIADFEAEYLEPVREYRRQKALQLVPVVSHSLGGLVAAHLKPETAVYLSPWWGFYGEKLRSTQLDLVSKLPFERPVVPIDFQRAEVGSLVTDQQWDRLPSRVSPTFIREIRSAQADLPPIDDAEVFCSLSDTIVGLQGIGDRVDPSQVTLYEGKHELYSSEGRAGTVQAVLDAVDAAVEAAPGITG
jgi:hypothetical protein